MRAGLTTALSIWRTRGKAPNRTAAPPTNGDDAMTRKNRNPILAFLLLAFLAGCSDDVTSPQNGEVSPEARAVAVERTGEVLASSELTRTAALVEDLTGGFAVGLSDETAGLDMELGEDFSIPAGSAAELSIAASIGRARSTRERALDEIPHAQMARRAPGDLIVRFTETNLDGSVSEISIYEGDSDSVVRVVRITTWPNGNLLLSAIEDEIVIDLGADRESGADDIWQSLRSEIRFAGGAVLSREIDLSDQGGFVDDVRASIVSTWRPRPNHPRLIDVVSTLVVDLHAISDENDDRFVGVDRITRLEGVAHDGGSPRVVESVQFEEPVAEGDEPCGGTLSRDIRFRQDRALRSWIDTASFACAGGGSLSREIVYADGSFDALTLTEDAQGIVHLDAEARDGTKTVGSFDEAAHSFEFTTTSPEGFDPVRRAVQGTTNEDETEWQLDEQVNWADGFVEVNHLEGSEGPQGHRLAGSHAGREETVEFELESNLDETMLSGWIENDQEQRIEFSVEELPDGSALLDFVATEPGVRVEGHLELGPDGCGIGTLTITENGTTVTVEVTFCDGELENDDAILAGN